MAGPERGVGGRQRFQLAAHRSHQNREVSHRAAGRPQHLCVHAVHVSDRLHPGESGLQRQHKKLVFTVMMSIKAAKATFHLLTQQDKNEPIE